MATQSVELNQASAYKKPLLGLAGRRRLLRIFALVVMTIYSILTIFPFYALFVRSFVSTKDSADLHLWIPQADEVPMESQVGNLAVFFDLDLNDFKEAMGISDVPHHPAPNIGKV